MCFKTAKLPAPSEQKYRKRTVKASGATFHVSATGTRTVSVHIGEVRPSPDDVGDHTQSFSPDGLREFAAKLNKLADKLEA